MNGAERDCERQGGRQKEPLAIGWLIAAGILLAPALAIIGELLARSLGMAETPNLALVGIVIAPMMILMTAPRTAKQLALVLAIVAVGGVLATLATLPFEHLDWGLWAAALEGAIAGSVGSGFILLSYFRLGIELRRPPENG